METMSILEVVVLSVLFAAGAVTTTSATFRFCTKCYRRRQEQRQRPISEFEMLSFGELARRRERRSSGRRSQNVGFVFLLQNLNVADLLIVYAFVLSELYERANGRSWPFGAAACKLKHVLRIFSFHLCSNIVVCVALERALAAAARSVRGRNTLRPHHLVIVGLAWSLAVVVSLPQVMLWDVALVYADMTYKTTMMSCIGVNNFISSSNVTEVQLVDLYSFVHTLTVSPLPLLLIGSLYACVLCRLRTMRFQQRNTGRMSRTSVFIVCSYTLCWLPYNVAVVWSFASAETYRVYAKRFRVAQYLIGLFPVVNPFLYDFYIARTSWSRIHRSRTRSSEVMQIERTPLRFTRSA